MRQLLLVVLLLASLLFAGLARPAGGPSPSSAPIAAPDISVGAPPPPLPPGTPFTPAPSATAPPTAPDTHHA